MPTQKVPSSMNVVRLINVHGDKILVAVGDAGKLSQVWLEVHQAEHRLDVGPSIILRHIPPEHISAWLLDIGRHE